MKIKVLTIFLNMFIALYITNPSFAGGKFSKASSREADIDDSHGLIYSLQNNVFIDITEESGTYPQAYAVEEPAKFDDDQTLLYRLRGQVPYNVRDYATGWTSNKAFKSYIPSLVPSDKVLHTWNAVGCLMTRDLFESRDIKLLGTGVQIEPGFVLTAAHNLSKRILYPDGTFNDFLAKSATFYPQMDGDIRENQPALHATGFAIFSIYNNALDSNSTSPQDFALVKLATTEYSSFLPLPQPRDAREGSVTMVGYPGVPPFAARHMVSQSYKLKAKHIAGGMISYEGQKTYLGQSGGAICRKIGDDYQLIGIHTHGSQENNSGVICYSGGGIFLSEENVNTIRRWIHHLTDFK